MKKSLSLFMGCYFVFNQFALANPMLPKNYLYLPEKMFSYAYSSKYEQAISTLKNQKNEIVETHVLGEKNHCIYFGQDLFVPHLGSHTMMIYDPKEHQFILTGKYFSYDGSTPMIFHEPLEVVHDYKHDWEYYFSLSRSSTVLLGDKMQAIGWKVKNSPENRQLFMGEMRVLFDRKNPETDWIVEDLLKFNLNQCPSEYLWIAYSFKKAD